MLVSRPGLMLFPAEGTARGVRWRRRDAGCAVGGWPRGGQVAGPRCPAGGRSSGLKLAEELSREGRADGPLPASGLADKTAEPAVKLQNVGCWLLFKFDASLFLDAVAWAP